MAKYDSMSDYIRHLKHLDRHKPFSTSKVDELILALQDSPRLSSEIKAELVGGHWDAIYSAIHGELVETEYWKHSNRMYWLTQAGKTYCEFLLKVQERDSETESVTDEIQGQSVLFPKAESQHSKTESPLEKEVESGNSPTTATEVAKSIGATILNDSQRTNVEHLLGYYKCLLLADETNRSEGIFLVSTELDHCVVQINGSMAERVQMLELIKQLSQQEKQNDNT